MTTLTLPEAASSAGTTERAMLSSPLGTLELAHCLFRGVCLPVHFEFPAPEWAQAITYIRPYSLAEPFLDDRFGYRVLAVAADERDLLDYKSIVSFFTDIGKWETLSSEVQFVRGFIYPRGGGIFMRGEFHEHGWIEPDPQPEPVLVLHQRHLVQHAYAFDSVAHGTG